MEARKENLEGLEYVKKKHQWYLGLTDVLLKQYNDEGNKNDTLNVRTGLRNCIVELYKALIEYQLKSVCCYYSYYKLVTFAKDQISWNDWKGDIKEIQDFESTLYNNATMYSWHRILEFQSAQAINFEKVLEYESKKEERAIRLEEREIRREQHEKAKLSEEETKQAHEFISWFSFPNFVYDDFKDVLNQKPAPNTGLWFRNHSLYRQWTGEKTGMLVLVANPGCGKSILARSVVDELRENNAPGSFVCHFFFKDTNDLQRSATKALCALIHQLLNNRHFPLTLVSLLRVDLKVDGIGKEALITDFSKLWQIFTYAAERWEGMEVTCVIDAMDECEPENRNRIIDVLGEYVMESREESKSSLKFLVTTRPYSSIISRISDFQANQIRTLRIDDPEIAGIAEEIDAVINYRLKKLANRSDHPPPDSVIQRLRSILTANQNRTYLWLRLVFDLLDRNFNARDNSEWLKLIRKIPDSVENTYERLLQDVEDEYYHKVCVILSIVMASFRPLKIEELDLAVSSYFAAEREDKKLATATIGDIMDDMEDEMEDLELEDADILEQQQQSKMIDKHWLVNTCGFVIEVYNNEVFLIHQTVKEYLLLPAKDTSVLVPGSSTTDGQRWRLSIQECSAHRTLAEACIMYATQPQLSSFDTDLESVSNEKYEMMKHWAGMIEIAKEIDFDSSILVESYLQRYPFLEYCYNFWSEHVRYSQQLNRKAELVGSFTEFSQCARDRYSQHLGRSRLMFEHYSCSTSRELLSLFWDGPHSSSDEKRIEIASQTGHINLIQDILKAQQEDNINLPKTFITLLTAAISRNHLNVVQFLLNNPNCPKLREHSVSLMRGCCSAEMAFMLRRHIDINATSNDGETILYKLCSETGDRDAARMIKKLIELGAKPDVVDKSRKTLLHVCQNADVAKVLISAGLNVNTEDNDGNTALHDAAANGRLDIVELLLSRHARADARNMAGNTPLQHICSNPPYFNGEECMTKLVEKGAHPNDTSGDGLPLYLLNVNMENTSVHTLVGLVESLLKLGANPNAQDRNGKTVASLLFEETFGSYRLNRQRWYEMSRKLKPLLEHGLDIGEVVPLLFLIPYQSCRDLMCSDDRNLILKLFNSGINLNSQSPEDCDTVLHLFSRYNFDTEQDRNLWGSASDFAGFLLSTISTYTSEILLHGADPNIRNTRLETPFFCLCKSQAALASDITHKYPEILLLLGGLLLDNDADPRVPAECGCKAIDFLRFASSVKYEEYNLSRGCDEDETESEEEEQTQPNFEQIDLVPDGMDLGIQEESDNACSKEGYITDSESSASEGSHFGSPWKIIRKLLQKSQRFDLPYLSDLPHTKLSRSQRWELVIKEMIRVVSKEEEAGDDSENGSKICEACMVQIEASRNRKTPSFDVEDM